MARTPDRPSRPGHRNAPARRAPEPSAAGRTDHPRARLWKRLLQLGVLVFLTMGSHNNCYCSGGAASGPMPATTGQVGVRLETTGSLIPTTGFTVHVGGLSSLIEPFGGFHSFQNLQPGQYTITIEVPFNCTVQGTHPRTVTVTGGNTAQATFDIVCLADAGSVTVVAQTNGQVNDTDGYVANLGTMSQPLPLQGQVTFAGVPTGTHTVLLSSVHASCSVIGTNPRDASVTFNTTTTVEFVVDCTGMNGTLRVDVQTTGQDVDPDGYIVHTLGQSIVFSNNLTYDFNAVPAGTHSVELQNVASNCTVAGTNPRTATIQANVTTVVTFAVTCFAIPVLAFESEESGDREVVTMKADGSERTVLSNNPALDSDPAWSWDGTRIAFMTDRSGQRDIWLMNADGTSQTPLTTGTAAEGDPAWSPDGTRIAFERENGSGFLQIWIMAADGSNATQLTFAGENEDPKFSPDGTKILFYSDRNGSTKDIFVMGTDGSAQTALTTHPASDFEPAWSPDGTRIVFSSDRDGNDNLYIMDADGQNVVQLTSHPADEYAPTWSPDGLFIAFTSDRDGDEDIFVINADGTNERLLTANTAKDDDANFRPGG